MKKEIMIAYNKARACGKLDPRRVDKALGIVQRKTTRLLSDGRIDCKASDPEESFYIAGVKNCQCKDRQYRKVVCAHIIADMILIRATQYRDGK